MILREKEMTVSVERSANVAYHLIPYQFEPRVSK